MTSAPHRIVLVSESRARPPDAAVRRYRLARLRLAERNRQPPPRLAHVSRAYD